MIVFCFLGILFYHLFFINYDKIMTKRLYFNKNDKITRDAVSEKWLFLRSIIELITYEPQGKESVICCRKPPVFGIRHLFFR